MLTHVHIVQPEIPMGKATNILMSQGNTNKQINNLRTRSLFDLQFIYK